MHGAVHSEYIMAGEARSASRGRWTDRDDENDASLCTPELGDDHGDTTVWRYSLAG